MKKIKLNAKKLQLNKEKIRDLSIKEMTLINGGGETVTVQAPTGIFTSGCTDGQLCHSALNCTKADCSNDCPSNMSKDICPSTETSVQSKYC